MLSIKNLTFHYRGGRNILQDVSLDIEPGHCVAVLGNNGAGKSTLLKCINRILKADSGNITLNGEELLTMPHREIARRIAFVAQSVPKTQMSVYDTVMLGRKPYMKWTFSDEDHAIARQMMDKLELTDMRERYVDQLSGGEQQKVMLARALTQQPQMLLLDEPTSSLDLQNQYQVLGIVQEICKATGITVLVIIHDLNLALRFCDRFLMMRNGNICEYGDSSVVNRESIKSVYRIDAEIAEVNGKKVVLVD
jgi:iron complex transport system ATP-binding protein